MIPEATVLVLGSTGMLGQTLMRILGANPDWRVHGTQRSDKAAAWYLDAESPPETFVAQIAAADCDYLINCIGVLKTDIETTDAGSMRRAIAVNSLFPYRVALAARETRSRVIHVSTDGVFSEDTGSRVETDPADCQDAYGRTKALGECAAANTLNIRCSLIGRDSIRGRGLLEWLLRSRSGSELPGFVDQLWNGVTTVQFARLCARIIETGSFERIRGVSAIHHFCPNPSVTKYELLALAAQVSGLQVNIRRAESGRPLFRTLGTRYAELRTLYANRSDWRSVVSEAINIQEYSVRMEEP